MRRLFLLLLKNLANGCVPASGICFDTSECCQPMRCRPSEQRYPRPLWAPEDQAGILRDHMVMQLPTRFSSVVPAVFVGSPFDRTAVHAPVSSLAEQRLGGAGFQMRCVDISINGLLQGDEYRMHE